MTQKIYAVFNGDTGEYTRVNTIDECLDKVVQNAYLMLMHYTHDSPYSVVQINDDGTETWYSASGEEILSPTQIKDSIKLRVKTNLISISPTPVEIIP